jgi:cytochrome c553
VAQRHCCGFRHNPDMTGHDQVGRIGTQREDYLAKALRAYKSGERRGYDPARTEVARAISGYEIADIARYVAHWRLEAAPMSSFHSITTSAPLINEGGKVTPKVLAAFTLTNSSTFVTS